MVEVLENISVTYRLDLNILFCRFIQPGTSEQLKAGYEYAFTVAQQQLASFWLFDLRRRGPARSEDEKWILEDFFPRIEALLKKQIYVAYLVSPTHYIKVRDTLGIAYLENFSPATHIKILDSEDKALQWLASKQNPKQ